ncbi:hypothetical protein [Halobacillus massiliensis]|uniref:hypothetical protein n=1 Tax=Halobacillus massiliensis TaxID=1926286 RepID=UPI0009E5570D|nr:hypothetical protein [Halobacillus massiliensis]
MKLSIDFKKKKYFIECEENRELVLMEWALERQIEEYREITKTYKNMLNNNQLNDKSREDLERIEKDLPRLENMLKEIGSYRDYLRDSIK